MDIEIELLKALRDGAKKVRWLTRNIDAHHMAILSALNRQTNHGHVLQYEENIVSLTFQGLSFLHEYEKSQRLHAQRAASREERNQIRREQFRLLRERASR